MTCGTICSRLVLVACGLVGAALMGCVAFAPPVQSQVEDLNERPAVAIMLFGFDLDITTLSAVKTVDGILSPEEEATQLAEALRQIQQKARWLLLSRLATGQGFRMVPLAHTDALAEEVQLKPGVLPNAEQLAVFRCRLGADLVVVGSILDYGKWGIQLNTVMLEFRNGIKHAESATCLADKSSWCHLNFAIERLLHWISSYQLTLGEPSYRI